MSAKFPRRGEVGHIWPTVYISSFSKLNTYVSFKSKFCMEGYLDTILNRTHRIWYTKIRISNHRFAVETGRFSKIPRDERLCLFCKKNKQTQ